MAVSTAVVLLRWVAAFAVAAAADGDDDDYDVL
jgi:hypothetical protein